MMNPEDYYEALPLPAISIGLKVWVYDINRREMKIPKKARARGVAYSAEELEDRVFQEEHAWRIAERVRACDPKTLRRVADALGYVAATD